MSIEKSISWLSKRLKNEYDIKALNEIINWVNDTGIINVNANLLFAKLFISKLNDIKQHDFGSEVYPVNQKAMTNILKLDLDEHYKQFQETLNTNYRREILEQNGINSKPDCIKTEHELEFDELMIKNISKEDIKKIKSGLYELDEVKDRLNNMISNALLKYQV